MVLYICIFLPIKKKKKKDKDVQVLKTVSEVLINSTSGTEFKDDSNLVSSRPMGNYEYNHTVEP